ncbi:alpha/beta hydrolase [Planotetraspora thailandica]|uniref:Alpha/beta hydrolase n=1 Tax=Planotetraspora thailandica TaxID=487172 RepID=A0A8J3XXL2_9ACTN|nr:alpha/beta hydrolase [Planotetraspora thailandica]GII56779.1 alpha/beta hydrolase [Planotetraspora thailandica]
MGRRDQTVSADGTVITYEVDGNGEPALVVVPGGTRAARHYAAMAAGLSGRLTVYALNRRGRSGSGPQRGGHIIADDCADVAALMDLTGAHFLFGHSYGGLVALETALRHPGSVVKLALYEPAVAAHKPLPLEWMPDYERALARGRHGEAMIRMIKGLRMGGLLDRVPTPVLMPLVGLMMRSDQGREWRELAGTFPAEVRAIQRLDATVARYRDVEAETLLIMGDRSPDYLREAVDALAVTMPRARAETLTGVGHNAPDEDDPAKVADLLAAFF